MTEFSPQAKQEFDQIVSLYPEKRAALLPVLHLAQREFEWLSVEAIEYVASIMGLSPAQVASVISFYSIFNTKPVGKYHVQICRNITCTMMGSEDLVDCVRARCNIDVGETTPDGKFTLTTVECLGSCDTSPVMQVNDRYYENLTIEKVQQLLDEFESKDHS